MIPEATPDPLRVALRLSELVSARLCHDLSGLLGTLMGTLELAVEDPVNAEEALTLANEAAASLGRRLRLLRAAWAEAGDALSVVSLQRLAEGLSYGGRIRLDIAGLEQDAEFSPIAGRVLLNVLLVAVEALPAGRGVIALSGSARQQVLVTLDGPRAAWPTGLAGALAAPQQLWTLLGGDGLGNALAPTRNLQIALAVMTARAGNFTLSFLMPGGGAAQGNGGGAAQGNGGGAAQGNSGGAAQGNGGGAGANNGGGAAQANELPAPLLVTFGRG